MTRIQHLFIALTVLLLYKCQPASAQTPVNATIAQLLQHKIDSCVNNYQLPGISVSLLLPGNEYWNGSSGVSDIYSNQPMTTDLLFMEASVTKLYTATIIFQLMEEGSLSMEDSVGKFLPPMVNVPSNTKIKYLVTHRSGLFDFIAENPAVSSNWFSTPDSIWDRKNAIETYNGAPHYAQGAGFNYSNTNFVLLGMIVEAITGHSFAYELHQRLTIPYGLNHTYMPYADVVPEEQVHGWTSYTTANVYDTDVTPLLNNCLYSMIFTAGSIVSKPSDVTKFTRLLFTGQIISESSLALMKTVTNVNFSDGCNGYGYGTMRYPFNGKIFFGHGGDFSGITQLTVHNEEGVTLAISINRNNAPRGPIAQSLLAIVNQYLSGAGVPENKAEQSLRIYPNPASQQLKISAELSTPTDLHVEVTDQLGQLVMQQDIKPGNGNEFSPLDIRGLSPGIYTLKIVGAELNSVRKITLQ